MNLTKHIDSWKKVYKHRKKHRSPTEHNNFLRTYAKRARQLLGKDTNSQLNEA